MIDFLSVLADLCKDDMRTNPMIGRAINYINSMVETLGVYTQNKELKQTNIYNENLNSNISNKSTNTDKNFSSKPLTLKDYRKKLMGAINNYMDNYESITDMKDKIEIRKEVEKAWDNCIYNYHYVTPEFFYDLLNNECNNDKTIFNALLNNIRKAFPKSKKEEIEFDTIASAIKDQIKKIQRQQKPEIQPDPIDLQVKEDGNVQQILKDMKLTSDFQVLGAGANGRVYLGKTETGKKVAIKVLSKQTIYNQGNLNTLIKKEIDAAHMLTDVDKTHVCAPDNLKYTESYDTAVIQMPFMNKGDLEKSSWTENMLAEIAMQSLKGFQALAEKKLVDEDIKAGNIFLNREGNDFNVKVGDFGYLSKQGATKNNFNGSPITMSPEKINPDQQYTSTQREVVFGFGMLLYQFITGSFMDIRGAANIPEHYNNNLKDPQTYKGFIEHNLESRTSGIGVGAQTELIRYKELIKKCIAFNPEDRVSLQDIELALTKLGV